MKKGILVALFAVVLSLFVASCSCSGKTTSTSTSTSATYNGLGPYEQYGNN